MLSLAFLNIIINALKAIETEDGKLWIAVYQSQDEVRVIFKDNGTGMTSDVCDRIFNNSFSDKPNGLGCGLAHVKEIMDWHNATVSVNSEPGTGTSFVIVFKSI